MSDYVPGKLVQKYHRDTTKKKPTPMTPIPETPTPRSQARDTGPIKRIRLAPLYGPDEPEPVPEWLVAGPPKTLPALKFEYRATERLPNGENDVI